MSNNGNRGGKAAGGAGGKGAGTGGKSGADAARKGKAATGKPGKPGKAAGGKRQAAPKLPPWMPEPPQDARRAPSKAAAPPRAPAPARPRLHDPFAALLFCTPLKARHVVINGRRIVDDGQLLPIELPILIERHNRLARELVNTGRA